MIKLDIVVWSSKPQKEYALVNYYEIIVYYQLPFYRKWFLKCPVKKLIEVKK